MTGHQTEGPLDRKAGKRLISPEMIAEVVTRPGAKSLPVMTRGVLLMAKVAEAKRPADNLQDAALVDERKK